MNGSALHQTAADCAEELPGARLAQPFGPAWEVYKVRGKVFLLMTEVPGRPVVILKADPGERPDPLMYDDVLSESGRDAGSRRESPCERRPPSSPS